MNRENEWKVFAALLTDRIADKPRDELVANLRDNLPDPEIIARLRVPASINRQIRAMVITIISAELVKEISLPAISIAGQFLDLELFEWAVFLAAVCIEDVPVIPRLDPSLRLRIIRLSAGLYPTAPPCDLDDPIDVKHSR